jgi:preprotein translocase subunit SecE
VTVSKTVGWGFEALLACQIWSFSRERLHINKMCGGWFAACVANRLAAPTLVRMKDKIQIVVAVLILIGGLAAFYVLSDKPMIARVGALLGGFVLAGIVGWFSAPGREFAVYAKESVDEAKKVVWPTRKETMQSTGIIFVFVFIMALFLWVVDWGLTFAISKFIGGA